MHLLVDGDGLHDVFEQRSRPGKVPEVAQRLPDEAVAEELLVVVDEPGSDVLVCKYLDSYDTEEWKTAGIKRGWYYDGGKLKEFKPE